MMRQGGPGLYFARRSTAAKMTTKEVAKLACRTCLDALTLVAFAVLACTLLYICLMLRRM